ncbi:MAG: molybdopterin-guanine dinucleotide biosynthesis protein MobB [Synergistaceae bacterium]|nr:molybdopterin-guanine dinucleotide biosynthesis protein MobB [Synergistaceae bacterium]
MIKIIAVSGYKNSGKTTLCRKLLAELQKLGIRTGYIKRTCENVLMNEKTDTGSVTDMGTRTLLWGKDGLRCEAPADETTTPQCIASRYFPDAELLILEGGKELEIPKIWVCSHGEKALDHPGIFLVYDRFGTGDGEKIFSEGDEAAIAERLSRLVRGAAYRSSKVYIGDAPLPMKGFVADFIRGGILGMIASLKGANNTDAQVRVYLDANTEGKNI